jgi:hypothetical protein
MGTKSAEDRKVHAAGVTPRNCPLSYLHSAHPTNLKMFTESRATVNSITGTRRLS